MLHVTDSHISLHDDDPPHSTRMFSAFVATTNADTGEQTTPQDEFARLMDKAREEAVDLIVLGGDIINYPSNETVAWVLERLRRTGIPFVYTAGNHDWHMEAHPEDPRYDAARVPQLRSTFRPLFEASATGRSIGRDTNEGFLYGRATFGALDLVFIDNSNHQISKDQFEFALNEFARGDRASVPMVLLFHMPLALPDVDLEPKFVCGSPDWGAGADELWRLEGRPRWPQEGNLQWTRALIEAVQANSAPTGRIVALLTGHVHRDLWTALKEPPANLTALACFKHREGCQLQRAAAEARGALQYTTLDGAEGGHRFFSIRGPPAPQRGSIPGAAVDFQRAWQNHMALSVSAMLLVAAAICFRTKVLKIHKQLTRSRK